MLAVNKTSAILFCVLFGVFSFIALLSSISSISNLYCPQKRSIPENQMNNKIRHMTVIGIIAFSFMVYLSFTMMIITAITISKSNEWQILGPVGLFFYGIGRWCMSYLFVLIFDISFRNSMFESSASIRVILHIFLIFLALLLFVMCFAYLPLEIFSDNTSMKIRLISSEFWALIELIFSILMIVLFVKKLFYLFSMSIKQSNKMKLSRSNSSNTMQIDIVQTNKTVHIEDEITEKIDIDEITEKIQHNVEQKEKRKQKQRQLSIDSIANNMKTAEISVDNDMLYVMTRYTLLVTIAIISSSLAFIFSIYVYQPYYIFILIGFDSLVNAISMYFFNAFSAKTYNIICRFPHKKCQKCCICCISVCYLCNLM